MKCPKRPFNEGCFCLPLTIIKSNRVSHDTSQVRLAGGVMTFLTSILQGTVTAVTVTAVMAVRHSQTGSYSHYYCHRNGTHEEKYNFIFFPCCRVR